MEQKCCLPCWSTVILLPLGTIGRLGSRLHTPERRHGSLEATRGLTSSPYAAPEMRTPHVSTPPTMAPPGGGLALHRLVARALRVDKERKRTFAEELDRLLASHGV